MFFILGIRDATPIGRKFGRIQEKALFVRGESGDIDGGPFLPIGKAVPIRILAKGIHAEFKFLGIRDPVIVVIHVGLVDDPVPVKIGGGGRCFLHSRLGLGEFTQG